MRMWTPIGNKQGLLFLTLHFSFDRHIQYKEKDYITSYFWNYSTSYKAEDSPLSLMVHSILVSSSLEYHPWKRERKKDKKEEGVGEVKSDSIESLVVEVLLA